MEREPIRGVSAEGSSAPPGQPGLKPRVLVVDDDRGMCELLKLGLRSLSLLQENLSISIGKFPHGSNAFQ